MSIDQVVNAIDTAIHKLPHIESLYEQAKDEAEKMQRTIQRLANHIMVLEHKISILDTTAFFCEQVRRRKHQEIQELIAQKNRIERLIANILDGEGYSNLKQIVKENVKVVLSEKRVLISISFAAVIQTLKDNPQTVKLFQNIAGANDGEQYKDNDINIIKYLESYKDSILDSAKKNYENLVEALTNNAIDNAANASSSDPTLSLPSSSSTFVGPYNQNDTYRKEETKIHHNSKGDIAA